MEARAVIRGVRMSPRKMRVVANLVRGKRVGEAMSLLKLMPKKGAVVIRKLSSPRSPTQSRRVTSMSTRSSFAIATSTTGRSTSLDAALHGRANRIQHRTSHVTVTVAN